MPIEIRELQNTFATELKIKKRSLKADIEKTYTSTLKVVYKFVLRKGSASRQEQEQ